MNEEERIKEAVKTYFDGEAIKVAKKVADEATSVAKDVAIRAERTAIKVAEASEETTKAVLLLAQDIAYIKADIAEIKKKLDEKYVTVEQFWPVKTIVYTGAAIVLTGVVGAILSLVLKK